MYTSYFGFREKPFNVTPDPRFYYTNSVYQEAYATLLYGIRERKGFVLLTGEVGTGKTTLLRRLMNNLEATVRFVFIYNTTMTFDELLSFTCEELGLPVKEEGRLRKVQALNEFLIEQLKKGGTGLLLIDEAQNLGEEVLEDLRLLSNLETGSEKLLQIVLVGQPELEGKLDQPKLRQLKQRIALHCQLDRLKEREVGPFIDYRLHAAGYEGTKLFAPAAIQRIAFYSSGIPRLINVICDNALLVAYGTSQKKISAKVIEEVARDLRLKGETQMAEGEAPTTKTWVMGAKNGKEKAIEATEDEVAKPRRRPLAWVGVGTLLALLLGGGGTVIYPQQSKRLLWGLSHKAQDFAGIVGERFEFIKQNFTTSLAVFMSNEANPDTVQAPPRSGVTGETGVRARSQQPVKPNRKPLVLAKRPELTFLPTAHENDDSRPQESSPAIVSQQPAEVKKEDSSISNIHIPVEVELENFPTLVFQQPTVVKKEGSLPIPYPKTPAEAKPKIETKAESPSQSEFNLPVPSSPSSWRQNPIVIKRGTTVSDILFEFYGDYNTLAMDLIKEFNPHIENLNWILEGQSLWLPPLTRETLLRRERDNSYQLILASLSSSRAADLAQMIRHKGYQVVITPRRVADNFSLHRVEIGGLKNLEAANQAWNIALANRWFPFAARSPRKKNN